MARPSLVQALEHLPPGSFCYRLRQVIGKDSILHFAHQVGIPGSSLRKYLDGVHQGG